MKTTLTGSWELSDEHAASSDGQPVLVHRPTGDAYGPGDVLEAYRSWGFLPAARVVARMAEHTHLDADGKALVRRCLGSLPPQ